MPYPGMMNRNNRADQDLDQESRAGLRNVQDTDKGDSEEIDCDFLSFFPFFPLPWCGGLSRVILTSLRFTFRN
jgi:hypothetical protein